MLSKYSSDSFVSCGVAAMIKKRRGRHSASPLAALKMNGWNLQMELWAPYKWPKKMGNWGYNPTWGPEWSPFFEWLEPSIWTNHPPSWLWVQDVHFPYNLPSRELTYPTLGNRTSSSTVPTGIGYVIVPRRVIPEIFWKVFEGFNRWRLENLVVRWDSLNDDHWGTRHDTVEGVHGSEIWCPKPVKGKVSVFPPYHLGFISISKFSALGLLNHQQ